MLEIAKIKERIENPRHKQVLRDAEYHEDRLRFHCVPDLEQNEGSSYATEFLEWVKGLIAADAFYVFLYLFRYPIRTIDLTGRIFDAYGKVFEGQDPYFSYQFSNEGAADDWKEYKKKVCGLNEWKRFTLETLREGINSMVVVDLPSEPAMGDNRPQPYFYALPITNVIDFDMEDDVHLEWVIFEPEKGKLAAYCKERYRLFEVNDDKKIIETLVDSPHGLPGCPVRFFWGSAIGQKKAVKRSPLTEQLSELDWYLFYSYAKRHLDLYAPFPIYSGYIQECDYEISDERTGSRQYCEMGFLRDDRNRYVMWNGRPRECPICKSRRAGGPGSWVDVPAPEPANDNTDLRNPVQITTVDKNSLDHNRDEVKRLDREIFHAATGYGGEPINNQAINEDQVKAGFEGRKIVLEKLRDEIQAMMEWVETTICQLRYGSSFEGATIHLGTDWYLVNGEQALTMYEEAVKLGMDSLTLDQLQDQYIRTKYRNNPKELTRMQLIVQIDPMRHVPRSDVDRLFEIGAVQREDYVLKINLSSLIARFERENGPLYAYEPDIDIAGRVESIRQQLYNFITIETE
jgi:hypothetical protein